MVDRRQAAVYVEHLNNVLNSLNEADANHAHKFLMEAELAMAYNKYSAIWKRLMKDGTVTLKVPMEFRGPMRVGLAKLKSIHEKELRAFDMEPDKTILSRKDNEDGETVTFFLREPTAVNFEIVESDNNEQGNPEAL